jgi:hypothetical protein
MLKLGKPAKIRICQLGISQRGDRRMAINYIELVKSLIEEQAKIQQSSEISLEIIFDDLRKHYLLVQVGWHNNHWIYGCLLHLDIINNKVYIQQNNTEISVAEQLVKLGIPKTDIVIGFHSPFKRKFTEYAIN